MHKIKITDKDHPLFGQEVPGYCFYYDVNHTGDSPDLFLYEVDGEKYKIISTQIDVDHYNAQLFQNVIKKVGANVGDVVNIVEHGGGSFAAKFDTRIPHKITKISHTGYVEFDGGSSGCGACIFNVKCRVLEEN